MTKDELKDILVRIELGLPIAPETFKRVVVFALDFPDIEQIKEDAYDRGYDEGYDYSPDPGCTCGCNCC